VRRWSVDVSEGKDRRKEYASSTDLNTFGRFGSNADKVDTTLGTGQVDQQRGEFLAVNLRAG
ncbi:MAG: hypothetical protein OEU92_34340, partial [Alphaproteobacteria bacterium]|nr:hypothetical protein [Alphaproteobacteria bacterium]